MPIQTGQVALADDVNALVANKLSTGAGDNLEAYKDDEWSTDPTTYTKVRQIYIGHGGTLRIKFDIKTFILLCYGRIYRNGNPVGTEQSTTSTGYVTFSEDIAGWTRGDLIQLYVKCAGTMYWRNFRVYSDLPIVNIVQQ